VQMPDVPPFRRLVQRVAALGSLLPFIDGVNRLRSAEVIVFPSRIGMRSEMVRPVAFPITVPISIPVPLPVLPAGSGCPSKIAFRPEVISAVIAVSGSGPKIEGPVPETVPESVVIPGPVRRLPASSPVVVTVRSCRSRRHDQNKEYPTQSSAKCPHRSSFCSL